MPKNPLPSFDIDAQVVAAQEGDKEAFAQLYDFYFDSVYRYVYFRVPAVEVEDLVELVFIKAWMNLERYEKRDVQFSAWLFRIAHNAVIDYRRQHRTIAPIDDNLEDPSDKQAPQSMTAKGMESKVVREAIDQLKDPYRQVVIMKFLTGLSNTEIAEALGVREGNVRVIQFRALKDLKQILAERGVQKEFL